MRTIKFRGMDIKGKWYFGNLAIISERIGISPEGSYISNRVGSPFAYFVRPETVGQFTGLKDSSRRDVYEGDIVEFWGKYTSKSKLERIISTMEWVQERMGFLPHPFKGEPLKVIGNIYENSELLKA